MYSRAGRPAAGRALVDESWGVVDIGYYSTDFVLMSGGRWIEAASGGCPGVRMAAEALQRTLVDTYQIERDLVDVERALRAGHIKHYGQRLELEQEIQQATAVVATKVTDMAGRLMTPYASALDGVLVTGGGAHMVLPALRQRWPHAQLVADAHENPALQGPRFIVSEGYYRFGRNLEFVQSLHQAAA